MRSSFSISTFEDDPDYKEGVFLLQWLVHTKQLRPAIRELQRIGYFNNYPALSIVMHILYQYELEYNAIMPREVMENELGETGAHIKDEVFAVIGKIHVEPSSKDYYYVRDIILDAVKLYDTAEFKRKLTVETEQAAIDQMIQEAHAKQSQGLLQEVRLIDPIMEIQHNLVEEDIIPFGVDFLDEVLDGGTTKGEMIGILAPSGGGKTSLALQIIYTQLLAGKHILHISTEQGLKGDITRRLCMMLTGQDRNVFKGASFAALEPSVQQTIKTCQERLKGLYHFWDFKNDKHSFDSAEALFNPIRQLQERGMFPDLIILDWWGNMKDALEANTFQTADNSGQRRFSRNLLTEIRRGAEDYGVVPVIFHQLSGEASAKSSTSIPSTHSAQEDKNFNNMFDYCFAISQRDSDEIATLNVDKARGAARTKVAIQLDARSGVWRKPSKEDSYIQDAENEEDDGWGEPPGDSYTEEYS